VQAALARELHEELAITVTESVPWVIFDFDIHTRTSPAFRRVFRWQGVPTPSEGQQLIFHLPGAPAPAPLLPAALPVMRWLELPSACHGPVRRARVRPSGPSRLDCRRALAGLHGARYAGPRNGGRAGGRLVVARRYRKAGWRPVSRDADSGYAPDPGDPQALERLRRWACTDLQSSSSRRFPDPDPLPLAGEAE